MRLILEGCDGTGKTTLSRQIAEENGLNLIKLNNHAKNDVENHLKMLKVDNYVMDRSFISEWVYESLGNDGDKLAFSTVELLIDYCKHLDIQIIVLRQPTDVLLERLKERGDEEDWLLENLEEIQERYDFIAEHFELEREV